ncbi:DUF4136 domain-containing protein [Flavihumibacter rivuli]|uniref:DUF4136 domain-containing protein n=1 Tax=Flavihumibacter rivuli TaxID=2838156 RepID=UPI001BDEDF85|nr:DUF4136 domain-containing protein [Flavihumibacter rivuli]ULQ55563.1 DUF4136 domain-containing protein [Flavihumibacter rivuli]
MKHIKATCGLLVLLLFGMMWSACSPSMPDYIEDYDLVYTKEEKGYDFSKVNTYFLPDTVVHVTEDGETSNHTYDDLIISRIKANLDALGWQQLPVDGEVAADVVVLPTAFKTTYGSCVSFPWYGWWGWWDPWYPGYYPPSWGAGWGWGYPSDIICSSYQTGTLTVAITDPTKAANNTLPVVWIGILNGLLEGSASNIQSRLEKNIDQMFIQSPYLKQ